MNKSIFIFVLVILVQSSLIHAQICGIPNAGFENWGNVGIYEEPYDWGSYNQGILYGYPETVFKTTDANSGNYAIRIMTDTFTNIFVGGLDTLFGIAVTGFSLFDDLSQFPNVGGYYFVGRPLLMQGSYKYQPNGVDTCYIAIALTKWNDSTNKSETVASGIFADGATSTTYQPFSIPFWYMPGGDLPDTATVILLSGINNPQPGSTLFVDDLSWVYGPNLGPEAIDDEVITFSDTTIVIDVQSNDKEPDCEVMTTSMLTNPSCAFLNVINADSISFEPNNNFSGTCVFLYKICDGNSNCDTGEVTVTVIEVVSGIEDDYANNQIKIFPNPARDILNIEFASTGSGDITVFDLFGRQMEFLENASGKVELNTSSYPAGLYIIKVYDPDQLVMYTQKFSKLN